MESAPVRHQWNAVSAAAVRHRNNEKLNDENKLMHAIYELGSIKEVKNIIEKDKNAVLHSTKV